MSLRRIILGASLLLVASLFVGTVSAGPNLYIEPNVVTLDFGTTEEGTPVTRYVTLWNWGDSDLYIYSISVPPGYSLINPPLPYWPIPPSNGRSMGIQLNATTAGTFDGRMDYNSNDAPHRQYVTGIVEEVEVPPPPTQAIVIQPNADAHVVQETPDKNVGTQPILRIRSPNSGAGRHSFLRFNVPAITGTIESAVLRIRPQSNTISTASIYDADMGWAEKKVTWNNWQNGGTTFTYLRDVGPLAGEQWHEIDVKEAISTTGGTVTIGITTSSSAAGFRFYSRESNFTPTLEITVR